MAENQPGAQPAESFESSLDELEKVVKELEAGDLSLERSLELFERGMSLSESGHEVRRVERNLCLSNAETPHPIPRGGGVKARTRG